MTDFVSSGREFKSWKGQTQRRKQFTMRLSECLRRNVNKAFRTTLVIADYNRADELFEVEEFLGRPYALCCMVCTYTLRAWAKRKRAERSLLYYFEDG